MLFSGVCVLRSDILSGFSMAWNPFFVFVYARDVITPIKNLFLISLVSFRFPIWILPVLAKVCSKWLDSEGPVVRFIPSKFSENSKMLNLFTWAAIRENRYTHLISKLLKTGVSQIVNENYGIIEVKEKKKGFLQGFFVDNTFDVFEMCRATRFL